MTALVTANVSSPRVAPRAAAGLPNSASPAPIPIHSLEWSAARVRRGMTASSSGLGDSATASKTSRSSVPSPSPIWRRPFKEFRDGNKPMQPNISRSPHGWVVCQQLTAGGLASARKDTCT
ncbi:Uncharacterised protein [Mycobacteroides abscessus subsp. abscessus]|nr:Uncharacterised protein [Mycobacteroides abscessus subsp. abscessus]